MDEQVTAPRKTDQLWWNALVRCHARASAFAARMARSSAGWSSVLTRSLPGTIKTEGLSDKIVTTR